jgi:hypothetical protein
MSDDKEDDKAGAGAVFLIGLFIFAIVIGKHYGGDMGWGLLGAGLMFLGLAAIASRGRE